ncbi:MAG TPA: histidine phosphatase family protein [Acidimicrobiales bacterium]|nr:histidine phosphatase family protein [Acidimicrobiales bacterium]
MTRTEIWLARHGETEWSRTGRHTGRTDVPLTAAGVAEARLLAGSLDGVPFDLVLTSPRRRAAATAGILGYPAALREPDLVEWDYGDYEGLTAHAIREQVPGWRVWSHPVPGGETAEQVAARADRVVARVLAAAPGRALLVAHGHVLRVLAARWIGEPAGFGGRLALGTAGLCVLGWDRETRALRHWNLPPGTRPGAVTAPITGAGLAEPSP